MILLSLFACSDLGLSLIDQDPGEPVPIIEVSPRELDFGDNAAGQGTLRSFVVRNAGTGTLRVSEIELDGGDSFSMGGPWEELALGEAEHAEVELRFEALEAGRVVGQALVHSNDGVHPVVDVALTGFGAVPYAQLDPDPQDFGELPAGCTELATLTLQNVGEATLEVESLELVGDSALWLEQAPELPLSLSPGAWVPLEVGFEAGGSGRSESVIQVASNDPRGIIEARQLGEALPGDARSETFAVSHDPPVDILFAVDQSCSMDDDAEALASGFGAFVDALEQATEGWQVGVVTLDHGCVNHGVLDASTPSMESKFMAAVTLGEDEDVSNDEALLRMADRALEQLDPGHCNEGLIRPGTLAHLVVVSDEPERSTEQASAWTWDYWLDSMLDSLPTGSRLKVSGVVDSAGCSEGDAGYAEVIAATGGEHLSICSADQASNIAALAAASTLGLHAFALAETPVASSLQVFVDGAEQSEGWLYDAASNSVVFGDHPGGDQVLVDYQVPLACP